jgi:hypothetical protein
MDWSQPAQYCTYKIGPLIRRSLLQSSKPAAATAGTALTAIRDALALRQGRGPRSAHPGSAATIGLPLTRNEEATRVHLQFGEALACYLCLTFSNASFRGGGRGAGVESPHHRSSRSTSPVDPICEFLPSITNSPESYSLNSSALFFSSLLGVCKAVHNEPERGHPARADLEPTPEPGGPFAKMRNDVVSSTRVVRDIRKFSELTLKTALAG